MSNLNLNKAAAAVLLAGLVGMVTGKAAEFLYVGHFEHPGHQEEEKRGYKIDVVETTDAAGGEAKPAGAADISALYATADAKAGQDYFDKHCTVCHNIGKGTGNKVGPHLWGVMGRAVASVADFNYSSAMKKHAGEVKSWSFDAMNHFQYKPSMTVPGTMMSYGGTPNDQMRANLIVYLNSQGDSPLPLPKATAPAPAKEEPKADAAKPATEAKKEVTPPKK